MCGFQEVGEREVMDAALARRSALFHLNCSKILPQSATSWAKRKIPLNSSYLTVQSPYAPRKYLPLQLALQAPRFPASHSSRVRRTIQRPFGFAAGWASLGLRERIERRYRWYIQQFRDRAGSMVSGRKLNFGWILTSLLGAWKHRCRFSLVWLGFHCY